MARLKIKSNGTSLGTRIVFLNGNEEDFVNVKIEIND